MNFLVHSPPFYPLTIRYRCNFSGPYRYLPKHRFTPHNIKWMNTQSWGVRFDRMLNLSTTPVKLDAVRRLYDPFLINSSFDVSNYLRCGQAGTMRCADDTGGHQRRLNFLYIGYVGLIDTGISPKLTKLLVLHPEQCYKKIEIYYKSMGTVRSCNIFYFICYT